MVPLATSVELPFSIMHSYRHHVIVPQRVGGWTGPYTLGWLLVASLVLVFDAYHFPDFLFPLVEGLPSWFTRVALLHPGEWTFPSPLFTHHYFIVARSSWCIPTPRFGPSSWVLRRGWAIPARSPDVAHFGPPPILSSGHGHPHVLSLQLEWLPCVEGGWWMEKLGMEERHWRLHSSLAYSKFLRERGEERSIEFALGEHWSSLGVLEQHQRRSYFSWEFLVCGSWRSSPWSILGAVL
eukprot:Gb_13379 [translate_table: standard]